MPLFTRIGYLIGGALSVLVFGGSIIGANYSGVILHHLADVVQGVNTSVVVSTNAPNWEEGTPLAQVVGLTGATTTGTTASSTAFVFAVAALDGNGTTTLSAVDATSTDANGSANEGFQLSWGPVQGATGYAIYFATSSSKSATLNQYFVATTTNGIPNTSYTFATSSGSLSGTYTKLDTTAFSTLINPNGTSYLNGGSFQVDSASTSNSNSYFLGSVNNFLQVTVQNANSGSNACASYVFCNNLSSILFPPSTNCPNYYGEIGINSSTFSQSKYTGESANDMYLTSSDANLDIETASTTGPSTINFLVGGTLAANKLGVMQPGGQFGWGTTTPIATFQATATTSNATTTLEFGKASQTKGTCIKLYRTDGSAIYAFVAAGATTFTLTATANACQTGL